MAILGIALMHYLQATESIPAFIQKASSFGGSGVHIFFICSGFGLYLSYLKHPVTYGEFIRRRFKKIYIPYAIIATICALTPFMCEGHDKLNVYLSHIFLYKMFVPEYIGAYQGYLWFVSTIFEFYLIFIPLVKFKYRIGNKKFFLICAITSFLWQLIVAVIGQVDNRVFSDFFLQFLWEFVAGMLLAEYCRKKNVFPKIGKEKLILVAVSFIGIDALMTLKGPVWIKSFNDIFASIGLFCFIWLLYRIFPRKREIIFLSQFSYEFYLLHVLILYAAFYCFGNSVMNGCCAFVISWIMAYAFHLLLNYQRENNSCN